MIKEGAACSSVQGMQEMHITGAGYIILCRPQMVGAVININIRPKQLGRRGGNINIQQKENNYFYRNNAFGSNFLLAFHIVFIWR